jgi:biotin synthase
MNAQRCSTTDLASRLAEAEVTHSLTRDEIVALLETDACDDALYAAADRVRARYVGDAVHLRGLIEFSNRCKCNCLYCGLRRDNHRLARYRLEPEQVLACAETARSFGYGTVVLQSGEANILPVDRMCDLIRRIKALDVAVTLSMGEKPREVYQAYREAGADRYLLRIETTDRALYRAMDPGMDWDNRVRCLHDLRDLGYEVGTGCLVGLPGQSLESLADDILFFRDLNADMIGIGPFIANADTPLAGSPNGSFALSCKAMAITRLLLPDINIPATTAMETLLPDGRLLALQRGANVVMPNVTELGYRQRYALYPGKAGATDTPAEAHARLLAKLQSIGRRPGSGYGSHQRKREA